MPLEKGGRRKKGRQLKEGEAAVEERTDSIIKTEGYVNC